MFFFVFGVPASVPRPDGVPTAPNCLGYWGFGGNCCHFSSFSFFSFFFDRFFFQIGLDWAQLHTRPPPKQSTLGVILVADWLACSLAVNSRCLDRQKKQFLRPCILCTTVCTYHLDPGTQAMAQRSLTRPFSLFLDLRCTTVACFFGRPERSVDFLF